MKGKDSWSGFEVRVVARVWGVESADVEAPRLRHDPDEQEACFGKQLRRLRLPTDSTDSLAYGSGQELKICSEGVC